MELVNNNNNIASETIRLTILNKVRKVTVLKFYKHTVKPSHLFDLKP